MEYQTMKSIICAISHAIGLGRDSLSFRLWRLVLVMAGACVTFSDALGQVVVRDKNTNCFVVMSQPANTSDFKIGGVHTWSKSNPCNADGGYSGLLSHGYSFTFITNSGDRIDAAGWRYGYAVDGVLAPPYVNAYFDDFRLISPDKPALLFRLKDPSYSLDNLIRSIDQLAPEAGRERFDANFVKAMARIWDGNPQAFYRSMLNRQSDDLRSVGRGARGG
jgi:hypothetical protein